MDTTNQRSATWWRRYALILIIVVCCVGCDQATKALARETLSGRPPISLLGGVIHLEHAENLGAFMSLGARLPAQARFLLGVVFSGAMLIVALVFALRAHDISRAQLICLAFFIGGGIGNLIDRIWNNGAVTDFVMFSAGPLRTGILNLADIGITFGAVAFMLLSFFERQGEAEPQIAERTDAERMDRGA
jgi:signal peptidase II